MFLTNTETEPKRKEMKDEKEIWFKDTFLDSKRKLKEEVHEELRRYQYLTNFSNFCTRYMNVPFQMTNLCCR
jgi:hypothetical protein